MNEFELIGEFFDGIGPGDGARLGIGDDGAIVDVADHDRLVLATDTLIEGVHFPSSIKPDELGWRCLAVNLSDMAAMGAAPRWFTLAITLPEADRQWLNGFAAGLRALAEQQAVSLVGGDTTRGPLAMTLSVIGTVEAGTALRRAGAHAGDRVFVSGCLGGAAAGLQNWDAEDNPWRNAFTRPKPRVSLGRALRLLATAAVDISDGLAADLGHICAASGVGATIELDRVPAARGVRRRYPERWPELVLAGDDYELCFCAPADALPNLQALAGELNVPLTDIGGIESDPGLRMVLGGGTYSGPMSAGYRHF